MAMEIFRLFGSVMVDTNKADESLSKTDKKASSIGQTLANGIGTAAKWSAKIVAGAAAATTAVAGLASTTVASYADYEQLVGGVETLFGESADTVQKYAENAFKTAGMTANQYMETVTSFSASLLQGLNGDTAKAAEVADMAITDMSDNANKMGTDIASIQNAYNGFAKQNYTMLDNLKLGYGGTKSEMERLLADASKLAGVEYDISNLNDVYEAIHVVQTEMGITGTTAKEATSTISGSIGMIKAKFEDFKTKIGSAIAPVVQSFLSMVIDNLPTIEGLIEQVIPVISDLMTTLLPPAMEFTKALLPVLLNMFNTLMPIFQNIMGSILPVITAQLPLIIDLINTMMPILQDIIETILPVITDLITMLLPPIMQIVSALLPPLISLMQPILELMQPLIQLLNPILQLVISLLAPIVDLINSAITPLIQVLSNIIAKVLHPLQTAMTKVAEVMTGQFTNAFESIGKIVNSIKGVFEGLIDFVSAVFAGDWEKAWTAVKDIFGNVFDGIKELFKLPINWIIDGINAFIRGLNTLTIPDWVPVVGGKGINIGEIPRLERGGVLEKGQTGFLEGNGAEAVVPLEHNRRWISAVAEDMNASGLGSANNEVAAIMRDIRSLLEDIASMGIILDTGAMVGALAKPMDKKLGKFAAQKARA